MTSISITKIAAVSSTLVSLLPSKKRVVRSRLLKTVALAVVASVTAQMPQFASLAQAGGPTGFNGGDVFKIKTTWGGGYALNVGGTEGTTAINAIAKIHFNTGWDTPNRWSAGHNPYVKDGLDWTMIWNRYSNQCLAVEQVSNLSYVRQQTCNYGDKKQWFALEPLYYIGQFGYRIRNLAHHDSNLNTVLTQVENQVVGTRIRMEYHDNSHSGYRQQWQVESCLVNGVEQQHC